MVVVATPPTMAQRDLVSRDPPRVAPQASEPDSSAAAVATLRTQVEEAGLTPAQARSLQDRVDRVLARTGGTQIAINQVTWDGGDTLIPLPGEKRARELDAKVRWTIYGCEYYQFCTYGTRHFGGMVDRMSSCGWHVSHGFFQSYVNNQTADTRAKFYRYYRQFITSTQPPAYAGTVPEWIGHATHYIRPC